MKLPDDTTIDTTKFTEYLLLPQARSDKSRYLACAGYTLENVERIIADLRSQLLPLDAILSRTTLFGDTYCIDGWLAGPSGIRVHVRTVWQRQPLSGVVHFVTLIPKPQPVI